MIHALCLMTLLLQQAPAPAGPSLVRRELPNGLTAIVCARPMRGLAAVDIWVRAGSAHERDDEHGAAHFLEHLLFKGTARRKPGEIDAEIERMGGMLNAGTTRDAAHFFAVVPAERVADALEVMRDALFASALAEDQVELERQVILDELARADDDSGQLLDDAAFALAWADDAYARPVLSRAPEIGAISRESIRAFYERLYRSDRMAVVVVGDVDDEAVHRTVARVFGNVNADRSALPMASVGQVSTDTRGTMAGPLLVTQRGSRPLLAVWAWRAAATASDASAHPARHHGILAALTAEILQDAVARSPGAGPIQAESVALQRGATIYLWTEVGQPETRAMTSAIEAVLRRLARDGPSAAEIEAARRRLLGRRLYRIETVLGLAREIGLWWALGEAAKAVEMPDRLRGVTGADVRGFVQRYLEPRAASQEPTKP